MGKKKSAEVTVRFRSPSFRHKGKKYFSKDVEAAANAGDEDARLMIAELVRKGSGVIVVQEEEEPAALKITQTKPKATRSRKGKKAGSEGTPEPEMEKEDNDA